jgi:nicotinamidase-related amidase
MTAHKSAALLVIDVQESFRHRPGWDPEAIPGFLAAQNALIEGAQTRGLPIVRVFHVVPDGVFAPASGHVVPMAGLAGFEPALEVRKQRHSALAGTDLGAWLIERGITKVLISGMRTEQCCETTARAASDAGFEVDFVTGATLTFAMRHANGRTYTPEEIRERTELVLAGRFATICTVAEALARA